MVLCDQLTENWKYISDFLYDSPTILSAIKKTLRQNLSQYF